MSGGGGPHEHEGFDDFLSRSVFGFLGAGQGRLAYPHLANMWPQGIAFDPGHEHGHCIGGEGLAQGHAVREPSALLSKTCLLHVAIWRRVV